MVVSLKGDSWAQRYLDFAAWLPLHAAHVRQLSVRALSLPSHSPSNEEKGCAFEATIGLRASCASARQLTSLTLTLGCEFQQGRWLPALRTLRSVSIQTLRGAAFSASLAPLTALEELELGGLPTELPEGVRLPSSLTALHMRYLQTPLDTDLVSGGSA